MSHAPEDDLPWTEERWEQQFRESEARGAKYQELFETLLDHPDRDAIINREMGWDCAESPHEEVSELIDALEHPDPEEMEEAEAEMEERHAELQQMPAYARADEFGMCVHNALKVIPEAPGEEPDEDQMAALGSAFNIGAKLAGAHALGDDDDMIGGNIVRCKRALAAAEECVRALRSLRERRLLPAAVLDSLVIEGEVVRDLVAEHITALRARVGWDKTGAGD